MTESMKDNKAVKMLKAAEEGGYGVIGVVSVCFAHPRTSPSSKKTENMKVQPRNNNRRSTSRRKEEIPSTDPTLPMGPPLLPPPHPPSSRRLLNRLRAHNPSHGPRPIRRGDPEGG